MDYFEWIPVDTPVETQTLPESSRRTLAQLACEKRDFRAVMLARGHSEQMFDAAWPRSFFGWLLEDSREAARSLAAHMRAANSYEVSLIFLDN
jgi:hypothetical protein